MKRSIRLLAIVAAITMAFAFKPKEWTLLGCYNTASQRDQKMVEALTAILSGGYQVTEVNPIERSGYYCYEITLMPV